MKKNICILLLIVILLFIKNFNISTKNLNEAASLYSTKRTINNNKLYKLDSWDLIFSDGTFAIINVTGRDSKEPHDIITYKINLQKNKKGHWKLRN